MDKKDFYGSAQIAGGTYIGYKALKHGLPRALGIRIEYHTTSKQNAVLIKDAGNILNPIAGGKKGFGQKLDSKLFIDNSQNYVHITGLHKDSQLFDIPYYKKLHSQKVPLRTLGRMREKLMYMVLGSGYVKKVENFRLSKRPFFSKIKVFLSSLMYAKVHNRTRRFSIPGIDSYFNREFIPDPHDFYALKSTKPVKVYNNRFSAMLSGLKKFGLKGIKENKSRAIAGTAVLSCGLYVGCNLIKKGWKNINKKGSI